MTDFVQWHLSSCRVALFIPWPVLYCCTLLLVDCYVICLTVVPNKLIDAVCTWLVSDKFPGPARLPRLFFLHVIFKQLQCVVLKYAGLFSPLSLPASQSLVTEYERIHLLLIRPFHSLPILINSFMRNAWIFSPCFFVFQLAVLQGFSPPKLCVHFFPHT